MRGGLRHGARRLALVTVLALVAGCGGSPKPRARAPELVLPALDGGEVSLRSYRGRVVVLHFFATWAIAAEPDIDELTWAHDRHRERLVIIGIALDEDGHRLVAPWRVARKVPYLVVLGTDAVRAGTTGFGAISVPTTVVIDRDGTIAARLDGPIPPGRLASILADLGLADNGAARR